MKKLAVLACLALLSCPSPKPADTQTTDFTCITACNRMRELGCEEGQSTPDGSSCEEVCENSFQVGISQFEWDLRETTTAASCEEN